MHLLHTDSADLDASPAEGLGHVVDNQVVTVAVRLARPIVGVGATSCTNYKRNNLQI